MDCIFCKIVSGEIPSFKLYEDKDFLAFLDIFPFTTGHTLVIPKPHYRWVWDVENCGEYMLVCQKLAKHFQRATGEDLVMSMAVGEQVPHAHIHLFPSFDKKEIGAFVTKIASTRKPQVNSEQGNALVEKLKWS